MFEVKCYINENYDNPCFFDFIRGVISDNNKISVKKGWEHGYHITLFGEATKKDINMINHTLKKEINARPSELYDEQDFVNIYRNIAKIEKRDGKLDFILQNDLTLNERSVNEFDNQEQYETYIYIHKVFDKFYAYNYWEKNDITNIAKDIYDFTDSLRETKIELDYGEVVSNGFISHYSHFVGFIYSLSDDQRKKVINLFKKKSNEDIKRIKHDSNNLLTEKLNNIYKLISEHIENDKIDFFSPGGQELYFKNIRQASMYHQLTFKDEKIINFISKDPVLCANRWILNVFYEKLVMLNIKPIDKFYMNYLLSQFRFKENELGGLL
ncbi:hypothetical protein [Lysinibacillus fusiformis]|uniref:hypothetical protein n=1 Tax=Lysinibacillus fusiformis TaxID=28031 RepID=UPI003CFF594E